MQYFYYVYISIMYMWGYIVAMEILYEVFLMGILYLLIYYCGFCHEKVFF